MDFLTFSTKIQFFINIGYKMILSDCFNNIININSGIISPAVDI